MKSSVFGFFYLLVLFFPGKLLSQPLQHFIDQGLRNSPLFQDAQNRASSAGVDSLLVKASQVPRADVNAMAWYAPSYPHFGYDNAITDKGNYSALLEVSGPLFNHRDVNNRYQNLGIERRMALNTSKITNAELIRTITDQYITVCSQFEELNFNRSVLTLMYSEQAVLKKFVEQGIYRQTDYLSFLIEVQTREIAGTQLKEQYLSETSLLKQICGIGDTTSMEPVMPELKLLDMGLPSQLPFLQQYTLDSLKLINQRLAIDLKYLPSMRWYVNSGLYTTPVNVMNHFGYSAGINFSIPVFDGHQRQLEYKKIDIAENTRAHYELFFKSQYAQQYSNYARNLAALSQLQQSMQKQKDTASELVTMAKDQLNAGNLQMIDFINVLRNYVNINQDAVSTGFKKLRIINEMNYLLHQ